MINVCKCFKSIDDMFYVDYLLRLNKNTSRTFTTSRLNFRFTTYITSLFSLSSPLFPQSPIL